MNSKQKQTVDILDELDAMSSSKYEKVARRMRNATQIADALSESGLSKVQFAHKMRKQSSEITKWLSGTHNFTRDTLAEISCVHNVCESVMSVSFL